MEITTFNIISLRKLKVSFKKIRRHRIENGTSIYLFQLASTMTLVLQANRLKSLKDMSRTQNVYQNIRITHAIIGNGTSILLYLKVPKHRTHSQIPWNQ